MMRKCHNLRPSYGTNETLVNIQTKTSRWLFLVPTTNVFVEKKEKKFSGRPNKKIPVLWVNQPYLNLLVKPRNFSGFLETNIILCILQGISPFKMHKIIFVWRIKKK